MKKPIRSCEEQTSLTRRELTRGAIFWWLGLGCGHSFGATAKATTAHTNSSCEVWSVFDFAPNRDTRELSGIAWNNYTRTLWAVQDATANLVAIRPDENLRNWAVTDRLAVDLKGSADPNEELDLEGIVVNHDGFIVCSEIGPHVFELDRKGRFLRETVVPSHFKQAKRNKSLESLTLSPDERYLFTTSEAALNPDGSEATAEAGSRVRILRIDRTCGEVIEHAYTTDRARYGGDLGVADLMALSSDELLVLERGWTKGFGNSARIYRVSLRDDRTACTHTPSLAASTAVLQKELFLDVGTLAYQNVPAAKQPQTSPLLDNYEGLTSGPRLADGRETLILVSDDNARDDQVSRLLVVALPPMMRRGQRL